MAHDYSKLLGRIVEKCGTQRVFSDKIGLSERTVSLKLNDKLPFKQSEIESIMAVLDIPITEIAEYFFRAEVQNF